MTKELLRMRLREEGRHRRSWEEWADPDSGKSLRAALLGAVEDFTDGDPEDELPRFELEWQGRTGGWRTFRAGA